MSTSRLSPTVELIGPDDPCRRPALRLILAGRTEASPEADAGVKCLEGQAARQGLCLDLLFVVRQGPAILAASLAVESPGRAGMAHLAIAGQGADSHHYSVRLLGVLQEHVWSRGAAMVQGLTMATDAAAARAYRDAGFHEVAELIYLQREGVPPDVRSPVCPELHWLPYRPESHALFLRALEESYVETLDCPALTGIRSTADVLAGHRATGMHDPSLWFVALSEVHPVGVLLLSPIGDGAHVEVVYMGVSAAYRRRGIAHGLLRKAVEVCDQRAIGGLTLAVDAANAPALALYRRWGFREFARRQAWLAVRPATPRQASHFSTALSTDGPRGVGNP